MPQNAHTSSIVTASEADAAERELDAVEHAVDERRPLHHIAHEDEQGIDRSVSLVMTPHSPLDHEVEDPAVVPVLGGLRNATNEEQSRVSVNAVGSPS
jgi:hypothetical protein